MNLTDRRQTDRGQTDRLRHNYSECEREFTFAKNARFAYADYTQLYLHADLTEVDNKVQQQVHVRKKTANGCVLIA